VTILDVNDPADWSRHASSSCIIGVDLGFAIDHCAVVTAGLWKAPQPTIGVVEIKQYALSTDFAVFADDLVLQLRKYQPSTIIVDLTNNTAFMGILANKLGSRAPYRFMIAAILTAADTHSIQPQMMFINVGSLQSGVHRWTLSKAETIEQIQAELKTKTLRLTNTGDMEILKDELRHIEREVRKSGSVGYSAAQGHHDDLVTALGLVYSACDDSHPQDLEISENRSVQGYASISVDLTCSRLPRLNNHRRLSPSIEPDIAGIVLY
jgi:hypothetical protein